MESDPIGLVAGLNTYSYVENMPTMYFDPFGLDKAENQRRANAMRGRIPKQKIHIGVQGCLLGCASYIQGDSDAQLSFQPALGGAIKFCGEPKEKAAEEESCDAPQEQKGCGLYDPNCDNKLSPLSSASPTGPRGTGLRTAGFLVSVSTEVNGSICVNIGPHAGLPVGPSYNIGTPHESAQTV